MKVKLNYTDGKKLYFFKVENGLYDVLYGEDGEVVEWGGLNSKWEIFKKYNLKRVPKNEQITITI